MTYNLYSIRCFVNEISTSSCLGSVYSGQRGSRALSRLLNVRNWRLEIFFVSWSWSKGKSWIKFFLACGFIEALLPFAGNLLCSENKFVEWGICISSHFVILYWRKEIEIMPNKANKKNTYLLRSSWRASILAFRVTFSCLSWTTCFIFWAWFWWPNRELYCLDNLETWTQMIHWTILLRQ